MSKNEDEFFNDILSVYRFLIFDMIIVKPQTHKLFDIDYYKRKDKILEILKALDINITDIDNEKTDIKEYSGKITR